MFNLFLKNYQFVVMNSNLNYYSPEIEVLDMMPEGVLCGSNEIIDENDGVW